MVGLQHSLLLLALLLPGLFAGLILLLNSFLLSLPLLELLLRGLFAQRSLLLAGLLRALLLLALRLPGLFAQLLLLPGGLLLLLLQLALMNFIMGSRLIYGMARQGLLPALLGRVHPVRKTPHVAIMVLAAIVAILAFVGNIKDLASATSLLLLMVFGLMNVALIVLKLRPGEERGQFEVPLIVPFLGSLICLALIASRLSHVEKEPHAPVIALVMLAGIAALFFVMKPKSVVLAEG